MRTDQMQRVLAWLVTCVVGCCACSASLLAQEPPRRLPLPIEVVPAQHDQGPEAYTAHLATDFGPAPRATSIPTESALDDHANTISLTTHTEPPSHSSDSGPLRIGSLRSTNPTNSPNVRPLQRGTGLSKVVASLAVVLGLLFGFVWASRRLSTSRSRGLPDEVVQVLGQFPLGGRQQATVVRFGSKLLALSITPSGVETIGELDDHLEVESLTQLCLGSDTGAVPGQVRDAVDRYAAARGM